MSIRRKVQLVFAVLLICLTNQVHAQPSNEALWGMWEGTMENWIFFPDNTFVLYDYDVMGINDVYGTYQLVGKSLQIFSSNLSSFDNVEVSDVSFSIIPTMGNVHTYWKILDITPEYEATCLNNIPVHMHPGLAGRISNVGTLNLRSAATTSSTVIQKLQPGARIAVISGPTCSEGYAWWTVTTIDGKTTGWVAEASPTEGYFVEPVPMITNRELIPDLNKLVPVVAPADPCGSALPTNLSIGSYVKVAFITGEWYLEGHKEPLESSEINNVYGAGERVSVEEGPVCSDGVNWWKVYSPMNSVEGGWVPEASGSTRFLLKLTQNPADPTGVYDVFAPYGSGPWHLEAQTLMRVYASADNSAVVTHIIPGFAYEVIGRNESGGMYQVIVNGSVSWVCGDGYYIAFDQRPHRVPVTDGSTFNCTWQDHYFDPDEEMKQIANSTGAKYYAPGEYPGMQRFAEIVANTVSGVGASADVVMSKTSSALSLIVNAKFLVKDLVAEGGAAVGQPIEIACTNADLQNLGLSLGGEAEELTPSQTLSCIAVDTATVTVKAGVFWGKWYGIAQLFLNSNTLNDFTLTLPLTHAYCKFVTCYDGPGVQ